MHSSALPLTNKLSFADGVRKPSCESAAATAEDLRIQWPPRQCCPLPPLCPNRHKHVPLAHRGPLSPLLQLQRGTAHQNALCHHYGTLTLCGAPDIPLTKSL